MEFSGKLHCLHKRFSRCKSQKDYFKPTLTENRDHIIIHFGRNYLSSNMPSGKLVRSIVELASAFSYSVTISNITVRQRQKLVQIKRDFISYVGIETSSR